MDFQRAYAELVAIEQRHPDGFNPEVVAEEIERDRSVAPVIAGQLTWDDVEAAHLHRVSEVHSIMAKVKIVVVRPDREPEMTRAYHAVRVSRKESAQAYTWKRAEVIMTNPDDRSNLLREFERQVRGLSRNYASIIDVADVREVLITLAKSLDRGEL